MTSTTQGRTKQPQLRTIIAKYIFKKTVNLKTITITFVFAENGLQEQPRGHTGRVAVEFGHELADCGNAGRTKQVEMTNHKRELVTYKKKPKKNRTRKFIFPEKQSNLRGRGGRVAIELGHQLSVLLLLCRLLAMHRG